MSIIYEKDAPRLSAETGLPISRCIYALEHCKDYESAKRYLKDEDSIYLSNIEGD